MQALKKKKKKFSALMVKDEGGRRLRGTEAGLHPEHFRIDCGIEASACHWASSFLCGLCPDITVPPAVGRGSPLGKPSAAYPSRGGVTGGRLRTCRKTRSCLGEGLWGQRGNGEDWKFHFPHFPESTSLAECLYPYVKHALTFIFSHRYLSYRWFAAGWTLLGPYLKMTS